MIIDLELEKLPQAELVIANLFIEYVGYKDICKEEYDLPNAKKTDTD